MARILKPPPGRLVVSVIYSSLDALADAIKAMEKKFGRVQYETLEISCSAKDDYREEMGENLLRRFYSFEREIPRDGLPSVKNMCHKIEPQFADVVDDFLFRTVNIDPGILTPTTLVMASHREFSHRIYLKDGVYGEMTLIYSRGQFMRMPWTNSDYCDDEAISFFNRVRDTFDVPNPAQQALSI